jgi:hypothetical protein
MGVEVVVVGGDARWKDAGGRFDEAVEGVFVEVVGVDGVEEFLGAGGEVVEVEGSHVGRLGWGVVEVEGAGGAGGTPAWRT